MLTLKQLDKIRAALVEAANYIKSAQIEEDQPALVRNSEALGFVNAAIIQYEIDED